MGRGCTTWWAAALLVLLAARLVHAQDRELVVGLMHPHHARGLTVNASDGTRDGFGRRLVEEIAALEGLKIRFVALGAVKPETDLLASGELDVLVASAVRDELLYELEFTAPVMMARGAVFARSGSKPVRGPEDLRGARVVVAASGTGHSWCIENRVACEPMQTLHEALFAVRDGTADYVVTMQVAGRVDAESFAITGLQEYGIDDPRLSRAFSLAVRRTDRELLGKLNHGLARLKESGRYEELYNAWVERYQPLKRPPSVPLDRVLVGVVVMSVVSVLLLAAAAGLWLRGRRLSREAKESEERYRLVANRMPVLAYSTLLTNDGKRERRWCSPAEADWMKRFPSLVPGARYEATFRGEIHPDDVAAYDEASLQARGGNKAFDQEFRLKDATGEYRWLHSISVPTPDRQGTLWHSLIIDVTELRRAEARTRRSERIYREIFERSSDGILVFRPDDEVILEASRRACEMYEFEQGELVGQSLVKMSLDVERGQEEIAKVLREGSLTNLRMRQRTKNGRGMLVEVSASVIEYDGQPAILSVNRDVTERARVEEALRENEARYRAFVERSTEGVWRTALREPLSTDMPVDEQVERMFRDGYLAECNDVMARMYGLESASQLVGVSVGEMLSRDNAAHVAYLGKFVRLGYRLAGEISEELDVHGETRTFSNSLVGDVRDGKLYQAWGTQRDVTLQRRAEKALAESERQLRLILDNAPIVAVQGYDADGHVLFWNAASTRIFGWTEAEAKGKRLNELMLTDAEELEFRARLERVARTRGPVEPSEWEYVGRDGQRGWIYSTLFPLDTGERTLVVCMDVDITERVRQDLERRQFEERLRHTQKLESLGVLAGGIAHDFNNLLVGILGNASLALRQTPPDNPTYPLISQVEQAATRAADLARQMLAYAGRGQKRTERVNLSSLVRETTELLKATVGGRAEVRFELAETLPAVDADATQIRQVVMNLLTNASEAIGDRPGSITVCTGSGEVDRAELARGVGAQDLPSGTYVWLEVRDSGSGMAPEVLARIFEPFFTTKFEGRGLGLSAVVGILRSHGGCIRVESTVGVGSVIRVYLPASSTAAPTEQDGESMQFGPAPGGHVLVVDDEPLVRDVTSAMLRHVGYSVETCTSGMDALSRLTSGTTCDAVVLDLTMPGISGKDTLLAIRRTRPDLPVLLTSGHRPEEAGASLLQEPKVGFIPKPFTVSELTSELGRLLHSGGTARSQLEDDGGTPASLYDA